MGYSSNFPYLSILPWWRYTLLHYQSNKWLGPMHVGLERVLLCYCCFRPDIGYVQVCIYELMSILLLLLLTCNQIVDREWASSSLCCYYTWMNSKHSNVSLILSRGKWIWNFISLKRFLLLLSQCNIKLYSIFIICWFFFHLKFNCFFPF